MKSKRITAEDAGEAERQRRDRRQRQETPRKDVTVRAHMAALAIPGMRVTGKLQIVR